MLEFIWAVESYYICTSECLKLQVIALNIIANGWAFLFILEPLDVTETKHYLS